MQKYVWTVEHITLIGAKFKISEAYTFTVIKAQ